MPTPDEGAPLKPTADEVGAPRDDESTIHAQGRPLSRVRRRDRAVTEDAWIRYVLVHAAVGHLAAEELRPTAVYRIDIR